MVRDNRWRHGVTHFEAPPLRADLRGKFGCRFDRAVFDPAIGEEVYGTFLEHPDHVSQFKMGELLSLRLIVGAVRTPHGAVAYIVWVIDAGFGQTLEVEHFLNLSEISTLDLLREAGEQSHFKFLVVNSYNGELAALVDYPNIFLFADTAKKLSELDKSSSQAEFTAAVGYVMKHMTVADLRGMATGDLRIWTQPNVRIDIIS